MTSSYSPPTPGPGLASRDGSTRARPALPAPEPPRRDRPPRIAATRRRSRSRIAAGAVLVVACVFGFLAAASAVTGRHAEVLVLARPVPAGAALSDADLTVTDLPQASGIATVPASEEAQLAGRTVAVPLTAGTVLTPADLGPPSFPPSGRAIVALPLSPGAYPPDLQPGARVAILPGHSASQDASTSGPPATSNPNVIIATVTAITPVATPGQAQTVVSLLVDTAAAPAVEQLTAPVLVELDPAGTDVP
ncbi:MAG: SAF domain-containing protein [Actinomycetota bacterium]|nr:SAF domain-containing protein [Actinomycetota bacterium]